MAFLDWIINNGVEDTGNYSYCPNVGAPKSVGNQRIEGLRFIMQPIHSNSTLYVGGDGDPERANWGSDGTNDAVDYCNWLNGTAETVASGIVTSAQPHSPIGHPSLYGNNPQNEEGPKQHILIFVAGDDNWEHPNGNVIGDDIFSHYGFALQGIFRSRAYSGLYSGGNSWEDFASTVGHPTDILNQLTNDPTYFDIPTSTNGTYDDHTNPSQNTSFDNTGLIDHIVGFIPLFRPNNVYMFNPSLNSWTYEDEKTGQPLQTWSQATDRFNMTGANRILDALFNDLMSTYPKFNSYTQAELRSRIFISEDPIQTGTHKTTNKYIRKHVDGSYLGGFGTPTYPIGINPNYSSLEDAIRYEHLDDMYAGVTNGMFDHKCQSWWNLIITENQDNQRQHVGNVRYSSPYTTSAALYPMRDGTAPALDASHHTFGTGFGNLYNERTLGGGILEDVNSGYGSAAKLISGVTLDTQYLPQNFASSFQGAGFAGLRIFPESTVYAPPVTNNPFKYKLKNLSEQNYDQPNAQFSFPGTNGIGQGTVGYFAENRWDSNFYLATEDQNFFDLSGNFTNATYTGYIEDAGLLDGYSGNVVGDIRYNSNYQPLAVINHHQIISIEGAATYDPAGFAVNRGKRASYGPTALYFNLVGGCGNAWPPSFTVNEVNPVGCTGNPANGEIEITSNLMNLNISNATIHWIHPAGQPTVTYSAGSSNHTGIHTSEHGGSPVVTLGTGGGAVATGLVAGQHIIKITDPLTLCEVTLFFVLTMVQGTPVTITGSNNSPITCAGNDGSITPILGAGGTAPFVYSWTGPGGYTASTLAATNLNTAGTYTLTITDAVGCTSIPFTTSVIASPNTLQTVDSYTPPTCTRSGAGIHVDNITWASGSYYPVTLSLTGLAGSPPDIIINGPGDLPGDWIGLPPDEYTISAVDNAGCTWVGSTYIVPIVTPPVLSYIATNGTCGGLGTIDLTATGGNPGYNFYYRPSGTTPWISVFVTTISGLTDGDYDIRVVDSLLCETIILNITILNLDPPTLYGAFNTSVTCPGGSDGSIIYSLIDPVTNLAIPNSTWTAINYISGTTTLTSSQPALFTCGGSADCYQLTGLAAGTYDIVAVDANGCSVTDTYIITEPDPIVITETHSDVSCGGASNDGSITLTVTGGTPSYTFQWSGSSTATTQNLTNLAAGTYTVVVTDANACTETITIVILGDEVEIVDIPTLTAPTCAAGSDGCFTLTCANGDFPFEVWISTTSATTGFLQIEDVGGVDNWGSVDLIPGLVICGGMGSANVPANPFVYSTSGAALNLTQGLNFWVKLISVVNGCETAVLANTIPTNTNDPLTLTIDSVTDADCCDECGGTAQYIYGGGYGPGYYFTLESTNAATSATDPTLFNVTYPNGMTWILPIIFPGGMATPALCPGDYTLTFHDQCAEDYSTQATTSVSATFTIGSNPLVINDIQYSHPFCDDCNCGGITIDVTGGISGSYPGYLYTCNDGLHWVDTDPLSTASGPTIFNIATYNSSTFTPGKWAVSPTPGDPPGFSNLSDGIYRIWVRDHSPCPGPVFDDVLYDCNPPGPSTCVNFCVDCTAAGCYADFVDIFADHSLPTWNGGTKVELENLSTLNVIMLDHQGPSTVGGSNGFLKFAVKEDYWWPGMTWHIEVFAYVPANSTLTYDPDVDSPTYGDVCCDVNGVGPCAVDCCNDIPQPMLLTLLGSTFGNPNPNILLTCSSSCGATTTVNPSPYAFKVIEVATGNELCPWGDANNDSVGVYPYNVTSSQLGTYVEFMVSDLSVSQILGPAATEAMFVVRVTNNVTIADPVSWGGISGCWIYMANFNCDDCAAAVIDNGTSGLIGTFGSEDCECDCPDGYTLDTAEYIPGPYVMGVPGDPVPNPNYNKCLGYTTESANVYAQCWDPNPPAQILGAATDPIQCQAAGGVWKTHWNAVTVAQNMPCCVSGISWGQYGAKLYGDYSSGSYQFPTTPIGMDDTSFPWVHSGATPGAGESSIYDTSGSLQFDTNSVWSNNATVFTNRLFSIGIWAEWFTQYINTTTDHYPWYSPVGIVICMDELPIATNFYLALASASRVRFHVNGDMWIDQMVQSGNHNTVDMWNIYPIVLEAGINTLKIEGVQMLHGPMAFAFELYPETVGSTPTHQYLVDPTITGTDIQGIVITDYAGNPISSQQYIGKDFHSTGNNTVGHACSAGYLSNCAGAMTCEVYEVVDADCPECLDDLEELVGCVGNLMNSFYQKISGGMLESKAYHEDAKIAWSVLLIKYLINKFKYGHRSCIDTNKIISWTQFLAKICPDCTSNIKSNEEVNYLPDPNESSSPIKGVHGSDDINTFDFFEPL